ncbi:MAG: hypothetical protein WBC06_07625, partial [Chitinophagaceae bacterium]
IIRKFMKSNNRTWHQLFKFCLGIVIGSAFCMKWMESDFIQNGKIFTIIGLEISYSKAKVIEILSSLDEKVKTILGYHLYFDFIFMAGIFPGIASLCMIARKKHSGRMLRNLLLVLAFTQIIAWIFDIFENIYLLNWLKNPVIGNEFGLYHLLVTLKWIIALSGFLMAIIFIFKNSRKTIF